MTVSGGLPKTQSLGTLLSLFSSACENLNASRSDQVIKHLLQLLKQLSPWVSQLIAVVTPAVLLYRALQKFGSLVAVINAVRAWIMSRVTARITVPPNPMLHSQIMAYLMEHGLKDSRTLTIHYWSIVQRKPTDGDEAKKKDIITYTPAVGHYRFTFEGHWMTFDRQRNAKQKGRGEESGSHGKDDDTIILTCYSLFAGAKPIRKFLEYVKDSAAGAQDAVTRVYRPHNVKRTGIVCWDEGRIRPRRKLASVTLDSKIKDPLIKDIETYLDPRTKNFYIQSGIPYRKGYLLFGPPGTGKTSFATALAGEYNLDVFYLTLSDPNMNDIKLETLFDKLPARCIVLMEDIDSSDIARDRVRRKRHERHRDDGSDEEAPHSATVESMKSKHGLTLSGLLNVLDGIAAAEGRIVLMTSNDPDSLDKALIRAGRIDRKVFFGYATHEVAKKLFIKLFTKTPEQLLHGESLFENIPALTVAFVNKIPPDMITPAEIQGFLLSFRQDPTAALENADEFVTGLVAQNKSGKNVEAFANEVTAASDETSPSTPEEEREPPPAPQNDPVLASDGLSRARSREGRRPSARGRSVSFSLPASEDDDLPVTGAGKEAQQEMPGPPDLQTSHSDEMPGTFPHEAQNTPAAYGHIAQGEESGKDGRDIP